MHQTHSHHAKVYSNAISQVGLVTAVGGTKGWVLQSGTDRRKRCFFGLKEAHSGLNKNGIDG